jgi:hypothetical protein
MNLFFKKTMDRLLSEFQNRVEEKWPAGEVGNKFTIKWTTQCLICGLIDCRMVITNHHERCIETDMVDSNSAIYVNCYYCSHSYYHSSSHRSNIPENIFGLVKYYTVLEEKKQEIWKKYHDLKSQEEDQCPVCFNSDDEKFWKQDDNFICFHCDYLKSKILENDIENDILIPESQRIEIERFNYWFPKLLS